MTLDTNCIIDLEENSPAAPFVRELVTLHDAQKINLRVVAASGSEKKSDWTYATNFAEFEQKVAAVGLAHIEILRSIHYWGVSFWDWCLWSDEKMKDEERKLHGILFPETNEKKEIRIAFEYSDYCKVKKIAPNAPSIDPVWRNAKCDVLIMWSHIRFDGDLFVTSDGNFHKVDKKKQLIDKEGAGDILKPQEAAALLRTL